MIDFRDISCLATGVPVGTCADNFHERKNAGESDILLQRTVLSKNVQIKLFPLTIPETLNFWHILRVTLYVMPIPQMLPPPRVAPKVKFHKRRLPGCWEMFFKIVFYFSISLNSSISLLFSLFVYFLHIKWKMLWIIRNYNLEF